MNLDVANIDQLPLFEIAVDQSMPTPSWDEGVFEKLRRSVQRGASSESPEEVYGRSIPHAYRKQWGQFFTPPEVARAMVQWATAHGPQTFLDPAVGLGIFLDYAVTWSRTSLRSLTALDIDPVLVTLTRERMANRALATPHPFPTVEVLQQDFLTAEMAGPFDAIVCNPPYIRHHDLSYGEGLLRRFDAFAGRRLSRNTNAYGLFLVKIQALLSPTGRAAVITPSEFLNADFGGALKSCLLAANVLHALIVFHHGLVLFNDLLTTACITLLSRQRTPEEPIHLVEVEDQTARDQWNAALEGKEVPGLKLSLVAPEDFDVTAKWRSLMVRRPPRHSRNWVPFSALARVRRGVATGANSFFTLTQAEVDEWGIEGRFLRPCITKAQQVPRSDFIREDFEALRRAHKKVWWFYCTETPSFAAAAYLREGERQGLHQRYLTRNRTPWYAPERREVAPILVTVFGRSSHRFVRNRAQVWNLTACHGIYPEFDDPMLLSALMAYLTSPLAREELTLELRTYGDGLLKVEPRDVLRLPVLDVRTLAPQDVVELATLFDEWCRQQRFEQTEAGTATRSRMEAILRRCVEPTGL